MNRLRLLVVFLCGLVLAAMPGEALAQGNSRLGSPIPPAQEFARIDGLSDRLSALLISPDGKTLYVGLGDGTITSYDMASRAKLTELRGTHRDIAKLVLGPDGQTLASLDWDGVLLLWDLKTSTVRFSIRPKKPTQWSDLALSSDGKTLLVAGENAPVKIIDAATGAVVREFSEAEAGRGYDAVAFLKGNELAVAKRFPSGSLTVFRMSTGEVKALLQGAGASDPSMTVDRSGRWFLAGSEYVESIWRLEDILKAVGQPVPGPPLPPQAQRFYHDRIEQRANRVLDFDHWMPGFAKAPARVDPGAAAPWPLFPTWPTWFPHTCADLTADGRIAVVGGPRSVAFWDLARVPAPIAWQTRGPCVLSADIAGTRLIAQGVNQPPCVWNLETNAPEAGAKFSGSLWRESESWFYRDGRLLAVMVVVSKPANPDIVPTVTVDLQLHDAGDGQIVAKTSFERPNSHSSSPYAAVSRDGWWIACYEYTLGIKGGSALRLFDSELRPVAPDGFAAHREIGVQKAVFSPSAAKIATWDSNNGLHVFDARTGEPLGMAYPRSVPELSDLAVTDDGTLVTTTKSGTLACYGPTVEQPAAKVDAAALASPMALALSPDGRFAATAATDHLIKLWSLPDLRPAGGFDLPGEGSETLHFLDANRLAACDHSGTVRTYHLADAGAMAGWNIHAAASGSPALALSDDGNRLAVGDGAGVLYWIDARTNREITAVPGHARGIAEARFRPGTHRLLTVGHDGISKWWDLDVSLRPIIPSDEDKSSLTDPAVGVTAPLPEMRVVGGNLTIISPAGAKFEEPVPSIETIRCIRPLATGRMVAVSTYRHLRLFAEGPKGWRIVWSYDLGSPALGMVEDRGSRQLVTIHEDGIVRRWQLPER